MKIRVLKREETGRKAKKVTKENFLPANIYGPTVKSQNVKVNKAEFQKIFKEAHHSKLIDLEIEGDKTIHKALIREVQIDPVTDNFKHVSFYVLNLKKEIQVEVPLKLVGVSKAVEEKIGLLLTPVDMISVHCLPSNIPDSIEIDISALNKIGDSILARDIKLPEGIKLDSEVSPTTTLAYIAAPQKEEVEEKKEEAVEGVEGEVKTEEGEKKEEGK